MLPSGAVEIIFLHVLTVAFRTRTVILRQIGAPFRQYHKMDQCAWKIKAELAQHAIV